MKLIVLKNNLVNALSILEKALGDNTNLPILKYLLIKATESKITLTTTNLEIAICHTVPGKIVERGEVAVPFGLLSGIAKNMVAERITFESKDHGLTVLTDNYEAFLRGQDTKEFPIIPSFRNIEQSIQVDSETLREALERVVIATQYTDIRPEISGVYFSYHAGTLTLVATDSFRLAECVIKNNEIISTFDEVSVILPLKAAEEMVRVLQGFEGKVSLFIDPNQIAFETELHYLISRLVDGKFPDYHSIIPQKTEIECVAERQEFIAGIKAASIFSGKTNDLYLKIGENKKFFELYSADSSLGENRYRVPAKCKGEKFSIAFNWRFLLDGLKIFRGEEISLGMNVSGPALMRSVSEPELVYVVCRSNPNGRAQDSR